MFKNKCIFVTTVLILFLIFCSSIFAQVSVKGYYRKDGTYVKPYVRTSPDRNPYNNYSFPGNYNPNTDKISTGNTETYLKNYYDKPKSNAQVRVITKRMVRTYGLILVQHLMGILTIIIHIPEIIIRIPVKYLPAILKHI